LLRQQPYNIKYLKESQDEHCFMGGPGFTGRYVWNGRDHENLPDCHGQRKIAVGQESFSRFCALRRGSRILGALRLFLPLLTGILPWLTPLAAIGLTMIQLLAIFTEHLPKKEYNVIPVNIVLLALSIFVVTGRWVLLS
jgi:DoxX-like protein